MRTISALSVGAFVLAAAPLSRAEALNKPGTVTHAVVPVTPNSYRDNETVATEAEKVIKAHKLHLLFVLFPT